MQSRVIVGRDVDVVREAAEDIELVGRVRLRPGFVIEIVPGAGTPRGQVRPALVWSWRIRVLGRFGPIYRGMCRWYPSKSAANTPEPQLRAETSQKAVGQTSARVLIESAPKEARR